MIAEADEMLAKRLEDSAGVWHDSNLTLEAAQRIRELSAELGQRRYPRINEDAGVVLITRSQYDAYEAAARAQLTSTGLRKDGSSLK